MKRVNKLGEPEGTSTTALTLSLAGGDVVGYDELTDVILWLQRDNDALNRSLSTAEWMATHPGLQRALSDLRDAERRVTEFTARVLAGVQPDWNE